MILPSYSKLASARLSMLVIWQFCMTAQTDTGLSPGAAQCCLFFSLQNSQLSMILHFYSHAQCSAKPSAPKQCLVHDRCSRNICWINKWMKSDSSKDLWPLYQRQKPCFIGKCSMRCKHWLCSKQNGAVPESLCDGPWSLWPRYPFTPQPRANLGWVLNFLLLIARQSPWKWTLYFCNKVFSQALLWASKQLWNEKSQSLAPL